ncbi:MAG TPA: gluconate 2-dehydrogenase subunit 3 family protein [Steroidobacteraceae bacterium]|nr:gluconate 2-dehydrogenase subunit 3 family protein [Steroidobacteraceae bacterium]
MADQTKSSDQINRSGQTKSTDQITFSDQAKPNERRNFLRQAGLAGVASLTSLALAAQDSASGSTPTPKATSGPTPKLTSGPTPVSTPAPEPAASTYFSLGPDEAAFIESLVNIMCPADQYTANGVDCGLAAYIDRQLAGPYGEGDRRYQRGPFKQGKPELGLQLPLTPAQFCKAGIAAVNLACVRDHGMTFDQLAPAAAEAVLKDIETGRMTDARLPLASWFNDIIYPLFTEACFADPIYGGNRGAVFWKMLGYPGLPATHALDMVRYRGKPYPGAEHPKSIGDFS